MRKKIKQLSIIFFALIGIMLAFSVRAKATANPNASTATEAVLSYIEGLPQRDDKRVLSGQFAGHPYAMADGSFSMDFHEELDQVHDLTGHRLALIGADYIAVSPRSWDTADYITPMLIDHWKNGGLITVSVHFNNPLTEGNHSSLPKADLARVISPGTEENIFFVSELDRVAIKLQQLEDEGAVVLFRPFHEMNGGFWWGGQDADQYRDMWIYTFNYLTFIKGLDNLLWVYCPNTHNWAIADYYPGGDYADMVSYDSYTNDTLNTLNTQYTYDTLTGHNPFNTAEKPIGFGENGRVTFDTPYSYVELIDAIKVRYPLMTYFQFWAGSHGLQNGGDTAVQLLNDSWIINREDVCIPGVEYHEYGCQEAEIFPAVPTGLNVR